MQDVRDADGVFAIVNGTPPDEGVMVEVGAAYALNKPVFLFRDDFRRCTDSDQYPLNLMLFAGLPESNWDEMVFDSIDSIRRSRQRLWDNGLNLVDQSNSSANGVRAPAELY